MVTKKAKTAYGVYIIESVKSSEYEDGENLDRILQLSRVPSLYSWADSKEHFKDLISDFKRSNFRYLHLSCHADASAIQINGESISNLELQNMLIGGLGNKRIFMSACKGANRDLASRLISNGAMSLIGTPVDLDFDKSALFWPSFYHVMNEIDQKKMRNADIKNNLKRCVDLFGVPINYYSKIRNDQKYFRRVKVRAGIPIDNRKILINFPSRSI